MFPVAIAILSGVEALQRPRANIDPINDAGVLDLVNLTLDGRSQQPIQPLLGKWKRGHFFIKVIGEVIGIHIDDAIIDDGMIDMAAYHPLARLGYMDYTAVESTFEMLRPDGDKKT